MRCKLWTFAALAATVAAAPAGAARWIAPDWGAASEPQFRPEPLYWFEVKETPYVYRTTLTAPRGVTSAVALARSAGYLYAFMDGRPVYSYAPKEGARPDARRLHRIDLTDGLTPGRHTLCVSAPREGFALEGSIEADGRATRLGTDGTWRVRKFAPTAIIEDEPWLSGGLAEPGEAGVRAGDEWSPTSAELAGARTGAVAARAVALYDDTRWRVGLLARKGIVIRNNAEYGWAGATRADATVVAAARTLDAQLGRLAVRVDALRGDASPAPDAQPVSTAVSALAAGADTLAARQYLLDELTALHLAATAMGRQARTLPSADAVRLVATGGVAAMEARVAAARAELAKAWAGGTNHGDAINALNECRYDRLGWIPNPDLVDSQLGKWGIRVGPVTAPTSISADGKAWLFAIDAANTGEAEKRETIGYNIENQWARVPVPGNWHGLDTAKTYHGAAWYRTRVTLPAQWQGHPVVLRFTSADADKVWVNDTLVGQSQAAGVRNYVIPARVARAGAENVLAFKVTASGDPAGITGSVTLACPELAGGAKSGADADVLATPLSPVAVLTPTGSDLEIQGWADRNQPGPEAVLLPSGRSLSDRQEYVASRDGKLASNWALLWMKAPDRPILLVFEEQPQRIAYAGAVVRVTFARARARVAAVRPWGATPPDRANAASDPAIAFWQRAGLAIPVNFVELTRMAKPGPAPGYAFRVTDVPAGPILEHTLVYDYLELADPWQVGRVKVAPLPTLLSYAIDRSYRGLKLAGPKPETLQDAGLLAPYRAVPRADRLTYSYPIEPYPRFAGFTSWMFSPADVGVPGNRREVELIKATGSNCYRPQHNFSTEKSGYFPATEPRTRVQIMADDCNKAGLSYMNNIDETLGGKGETVRADYPAFMERVNKHYEAIASQLRACPFFDVSYDLINEPFDHQHGPYNAAMKTLTARVRAIDPVHLCYVEPMEAWGAIEMLRLVEPTGDPLTVYSFHDYNFRLFKPEDRWPTEERDRSNVARQWMEAFKFQVEHGVPMHCGEFGGFATATDDQPAQQILLNDFFRVFDQFGMHFNYYSGREAYGRRADGSMALTYVVRAFRDYFHRGDFNAFYRR